MYALLYKGLVLKYDIPGIKAGVGKIRCISYYQDVKFILANLTKCFSPNIAYTAFNTLND